MSRIVIETERLVLCEMTREDFPALCTMLQDIAVMYAWEHAFSAEEVHSWIDRTLFRYREYGCGHWLAVEKSSGATVGQIGLVPEEIEGRAHLGIGWILARQHWHRGFALEGARASLCHAFEVLGAERVVADIRPENTASVRVAERLDMLACGQYDKPVGDRFMRHRLYYRRTPRVVVTAYDPQWPRRFEELERWLNPLLRRFGGRLEHVGSTSVPGLASKPVIDADYIPEPGAHWPEIRTELERLGFFHRGDGGLPGREMFTESLALDFRHNFYCCVPDSPHLANHLRLRQYLRESPEAAARYSALKQRLAREFPADVDAYCAGKSALLAEFLSAAGFSAALVGTIRQLNQCPFH